MVVIPFAGALGLHQGIHETQIREGITAIDHLALIGRTAIPMHKSWCEGRAAEDHRHGDSCGIKGLKIVLHESRGLHQQATHGNAIGLMLLLGFDDGITALFDAQIDHLIAIVGEDDVHQVLANIVYVSFDGGNQELTLAGTLAIDFLQVRLQLGDRRLHGFRALQHKGELHLPRTKQFTNNFHAVKQECVDDLEGPIALQGLIQGQFKADSLAIDNVLLQPLFDG